MHEDTTWKRYIIHVDMDAFYASVEQRDNPQLRGLPVIVGGDPRGRGVVSSASYQARRYGVHSAMPCSQARRSCPGAVFINPRFNAYREASRNIMAVFGEFTEIVEPMSLDEAYMDVTETVDNSFDTLKIATSVIERIKEITGLDASAGVSFNKFLAKVASGINKPRGIKVISPEEADGFLDDLPIRKFHGVGEATERKMLDLGILTGRDLRPYGREELTSVFGRSGNYFYDIIHGLYDPPVRTHHERRSIGKERTLHEDTLDLAEMKKKLQTIAEMIEISMERRRIGGRTITLKMRYSDMSRITRSVTLPYLTRSASDLLEASTDMLERTDAGETPVRLLGISVSNLEKDDDRENRLVQMTLDRWILTEVGGGTGS